MSKDRPNQRWRWLAIGMVLGVASLGCGSDAETTEFNGGGGNADMAAGGSGGGAVPANGGAGGVGADNGEGGVGGQNGAPPYFQPDLTAFDDNPVDQLFADPSRNPLDFLPAAAQGSQGYLDAAIACYAGPTACTADDCEAFASCCVGTGRCGEMFEPQPLPTSLFFDGCAGLAFDDCALREGFEADVFGQQAPILTERGFVPNGTATSEGGALIGDLVSLASQRVVIETQFALPVGCGATCIQSAGVAFVASAEPDRFDRAEVGLLLSGSRKTVSLIIGGQVADSYDAGSGSTLWRLDLSPAGVVEVERNGASLGTHSFDSDALRQARLALFGRNLGEDLDSAAITRIATSTEMTDSPRGWTDRGPITVLVAGTADPGLTMGWEPSIARGPDSTAVAFEKDGQVFVGQWEASGLVTFPAAGPPPALFPTEPFEAGGIEDPELVWFSDLLYLFYTAYDENEVGRICSAWIADDETQKALDPVLEPDGDVVSYDSPTLALRDDLALMVVRATLQSGETELRAFYSADPQTGWQRIVGGALEELTRVEDPGSEVTSPSLIVHNSAYQLYYARRTGTRWSIELAVSDEMLIWRTLGKSLGASGEGFDSLGARGADALSVADGVELVYMGQDGVSFDLGFARRPAPSSTALQ